MDRKNVMVDSLKIISCILLTITSTIDFNWNQFLLNRTFSISKRESISHVIHPLHQSDHVEFGACWQHPNCIGNNWYLHWDGLRSILFKVGELIISVEAAQQSKKCIENRPRTWLLDQARGWRVVAWLLHCQKQGQEQGHGQLLGLHFCGHCAFCFARHCFASH